MTTNGYRIITVVLRVKNQKDADHIWDAHRDHKLIHGCEVWGISEGNLVQMYEEIASGNGDGF